MDPDNDGPGPDNDGDADDMGLLVGAHVSYHTVHPDKESTRHCGHIERVGDAGKERVATIARHDAGHKATGDRDERPVTTLTRYDTLGNPVPVKEAATMTATATADALEAIPVIEAPDAARRAGMALPDSVTGAVVREASHPAQHPNRRRAVFIQQGTGNARQKNRYTPEALQSLVAEIQRRPKGWWDHSSIDAIQRGDERSLRDFAAVAVKESVHYDAARGAVIGDIECAPMTAQAIDLAHAAGDAVGVSIEGMGKRRAPGSPDVVGWLNYRGFCLVPEGGAGGMTVREADTPALIHEEHEFTMGLLDNITPTEVKDANRELYERIGREYAAAHPVEVVREAVTSTAAAPVDVEAAIAASPAIQAIIREAEALRQTNEQLSEQNGQLAATVDEMLAIENRRAVAAHADALVREAHSDLTDAQVAYVLRGFEGVTLGVSGTYTEQEALDAAVREAAAAYAATLPPPAPAVAEPVAPAASTQAPRGQIVGLGGGSRFDSLFAPVPTAPTTPAEEAAVREATTVPAPPRAPAAPKTVNDIAFEALSAIVGRG